MLEKILDAFISTGTSLQSYCEGNARGRGGQWPEIQQHIERARGENAWFTDDSINNALLAISRMLQRDQLEKWISTYPDLSLPGRARKRIGLVSAGNIPLAGFHDMLCVLVSGHVYIGKLSAQDRVLLPYLASVLIRNFPPLKQQIFFTDGMLPAVDAYIASGSNNTFRYFEYYFRHYPSILRKSRSSVAILSGNENHEDLSALGRDVFLYFGLGCRSVSKLYLPKGYDFSRLLPCWEAYSDIIHHYKYRNNYDYYKSIYLINQDVFHDNGFLLLKPDNERIGSPVSVVYMEEYQAIGPLLEQLQVRADDIQCLVGGSHLGAGFTPFGQTQFPAVSDYADGVDTLVFLQGLASGDPNESIVKKTRPRVSE